METCYNQASFPLYIMQKNPIGWVEMPVNDLDRAEKFYNDYFGLPAERFPASNNGVTMSMLPMDNDGYGSAMGLAHGQGYTPSHEGPLVYFTAPGGSIDAALEKAGEQGVTVLAGKIDIGEHGYIAFLEDSEGNRIGIHAMEDKVKDC